MSRGTKTTEFLKECMADALIKLMKTTPVNKIAAKDITDAAGVGRATWFRNFNSKEEAISYKFTRLWECWLEESKPEYQDLSDQDKTIVLFEFIYSVRDLIALIYEQKMQFCLYPMYQKILIPDGIKTVRERYAIRFMAYGMTGFVEEWILRKFQETPEDIIHILNEQ